MTYLGLLLDKEGLRPDAEQVSEATRSYPSYSILKIPRYDLCTFIFYKYSN